MRKEKFDIELEKELLEPNQAINQLRSWRKLFECLSKQPKKVAENSSIENKKSIRAFTGSKFRKSLNTGRLFRLGNNLKTKRPYIYY